MGRDPDATGGPSSRGAAEASASSASSASRAGTVDGARARPRGSAVPSQTLDRGLRVLEIMADSDEPMTIGALADVLAVHRSIAYRMLRTLEEHHLVERRPDNRYELGLGLTMLAGRVSRSLQSVATPELSDLANELRMTSLLAVADGDECVTLQTVEPRLSRAHVAHQPGWRTPIDQGAAALALLAGAPAREGERAAVTDARARGWAYSRGEVSPGLSGIAAPVLAGDSVVAAVAVLYVDENVDERAASARVRETARAVTAALS